MDFILEAHQHALELRKVPLEYRGPLYGLPISVKECYFVKGHDATIGLARHINSPAQEDSCIIKVFKQFCNQVGVNIFHEIRNCSGSKSKNFKTFPTLRKNSEGRL